MVSLARLFFWGYVLTLLGVGVAGMLVAGWELRTVFAVDLDAMGEPQRATLLHQYHYLKALELAFGLFCLAIGARSSGVRAPCTCAARFGSRITDDTPRPMFIAFMALEFVTGVLVWLAVRKKGQA